MENVLGDVGNDYLKRNLVFLLIILLNLVLSQPTNMLHFMLKTRGHLVSLFE